MDVRAAYHGGVRYSKGGEQHEPPVDTDIAFKGSSFESFDFNYSLCSDSVYIINLDYLKLLPHFWGVPELQDP